MKRSPFLYVLSLHVVGILILCSAHRFTPPTRIPIAVRTFIASGEVTTLRAPPGEVTTLRAPPGEVTTLRAPPGEVTTLRAPPTPRAITPPLLPTPESEPTPNLKNPREFQPKRSPELPASRSEAQPPPPMPPPPPPSRPLTSQSAKPKIQTVEKKKECKVETKPSSSPSPKKQIASGQKKGETPSAHRARENKDKLITMLQNSMNQLDSTPTQGILKGGSQAKSHTPTVASLASENLSFDLKYEEELIGYIESLLSLPEKGDVRIKLTLQREGTVLKSEIIHSASQRNRLYVDSILGDCSFPPFGKRFKGELAHTFMITLTAEDSR